LPTLRSCNLICNAQSANFQLMKGYCRPDWGNYSAKKPKMKCYWVFGRKKDRTNQPFSRKRNPFKNRIKVLRCRCADGNSPYRLHSIFYSQPSAQVPHKFLTFARSFGDGWLQNLNRLKREFGENPKLSPQL
jgi:hypothetical protein